MSGKLIGIIGFYYIDLSFNSRFIAGGSGYGRLSGCSEVRISIDIGLFKAAEHAIGRRRSKILRINRIVIGGIVIIFNRINIHIGLSSAYTQGKRNAADIFTDRIGNSVFLPIAQAAAGIKRSVLSGPALHQFA